MDLTPQPRVLPMLGDPSWFEKEWPATPYHRAGSAMPLTSTLTWSAIDAILNDQGTQTPAFRMAHDNKLLPEQSITRSERATSQAVKGLADPVRIVTELGEGATLVLQGLQRFWAPLGDICRRLAAEIGHAVFVNAYLTPRSARGFGAHHDPYHAWLAQIEGAKTWRLWAPGSDPANVAPDQQIVLNQGDVLWIPRGWWHAGSSGSEPSLHLTFTVWATKLDDVVRAVLAELMHHNDLSTELPPNVLRDERSTNATVVEVVAEVTRMIDGLCPEAVAARLLDRRLERFAPLAARPVSAVFNGDQHLRFHAHPEGVLHVGSNPSGVRLRTADTVVTLAWNLEEACRALLGRTGTFTLDEIAQPLHDGHRELLAQLLNARLICAAACRTDEV